MSGILKYLVRFMTHKYENTLVNVDNHRMVYVYLGLLCAGAATCICTTSELICVIDC